VIGKGERENSKGAHRGSWFLNRGVETIGDEDFRATQSRGATTNYKNGGGRTQQGVTSTPRGIEHDPLIINQSNELPIRKITSSRIIGGKSCLYPCNKKSDPFASGLLHEGLQARFRK